MTTFLLVRHAAHDNVGRFLAGRTPGIHLGAAGQAQAERLAERLRSIKIAVLHSSPRERTRETAQAIADVQALPSPQLEPALDEIDFGTWSGRTFDDLNRELDFRRWNEVRSQARTPAGDSMLDVQARIVRHMEQVEADAPSGAVVLVSHADVIKAAVAHHLGLSLDAWSRFEISPASITTIETTGWAAKVLGVNDVVW